jgi:uncharacterized protein
LEHADTIEDMRKRNGITGLILIAALYAVLAGTMGHDVSVAIGLAIQASTAIPLMYWALRVERGSLASLGIGRPTFSSVGWALLGVVATFLLMGIYYSLIAPMFGPIEAMPTLSKVIALPIYQMLLLIACATATEELVFRCYAISRLHWLTGSKWIASLVPLVVFVGLHLPGFGWMQVVPITIGTLVFTALYWLRRDFWCNALCHCLIDMIGMGAVAMGWHSA